MTDNVSPITAPSRPINNEYSPGQPRLNIFALPTRTNLLFGLMILVVILPIIASMIEDTPLFETGLLILMFVLPLHSFLRYPDEGIRRRKLAKPDKQYAKLVHHVNRLSARVGLHQKPHLLLAQQPGSDLHTFGSFTRRYLVIPLERADEFQTALESPNQNQRAGAEAVLLHELSHFANHDIIPALLSRSLLVVTIVFMSLNMFTNLLNPFLYNALIRFFDFATLWPPELIETFQQLDPEMAQIILDPPQIAPQVWLQYEVYIFTVFWPLIVGGLALLLFFRPALLRTRELYADARVAHWQRTSLIIEGELLREAVRSSLQPASTGSRMWTCLCQPPGFLSAAVAKYSSLRRLWKLLSYHPDLETRRTCLTVPNQLYGNNWAIAATAGFSVVLLNLTLGSLLISRFVRGPNATIPFVLGFTVISLSLLPALCTFTDVSTLRRKIKRIVLLFTGIKLIPQFALSAIIIIGVILDPTIIDWAVYTMIGASASDLPSLNFPVPIFLWLYVGGPAILFTFVMPITLIIFLRLDIYLKRQALTWYGARFIQKHPNLFFWGITAWLALILWAVVLPFYNVATVPTAHTLLDIWTLGQMGLTLLISGAIIAFLISMHRRYAKQCPQCHNPVPGSYSLGKCCPNCQTMFHTWLVANSK